MLDLRGKHIVFTTEEVSYISGLNLASGDSWDISNANMKALKQRISSHLEVQQNSRCAYCTCRLNVGGRQEIEHIAPKGVTLYPLFTFTEKNLVLVCQHCNSSSKKGRKNPIRRRSPIYDRCTFIIVHPYIDDPSLHFTWISGIRILIKGRTTKGKNSINIFKLASQHLTEQRAMDFHRQKRKQRIPLSAAEQDLYDKAINYFPD